MLPKKDTHAFTSLIFDILTQDYGNNAESIFLKSELLGYINKKTKSANSNSKARSSFANIYALYVLIEDYIKQGYHNESTLDYSQYEGAKFSDLLQRQRELPFGGKLQNHALNTRLNDEFKKFYPNTDIVPIVRNIQKQRYWIQEDLLLIQIKHRIFNIAPSILRIIDMYIQTKQAQFQKFIASCQEIAMLDNKNQTDAILFIKKQLDPNTDARIFEIISYAILKIKYEQESIWIGNTRETVLEQKIILYKTGRTNANDGGIDFVMKPIGRFFQVTETLDIKKYLLDIDKVQHFPITFVIKSNEHKENILNYIYQQAVTIYKIKSVVTSYMNAIEEIITVPELLSMFNMLIQENQLKKIMNEIIIQSKVEFNNNTFETQEN